MFVRAPFRAALFAAFAAATLSATPSLAQPSAAAGGKVTVRIADLDLASAAGRTVLDGRLRRAATAICGEADPRDLSANQAARTCRAGALAAAQPQVQVALANAKGRALASNDAVAMVGR